MHFVQTRPTLKCRVPVIILLAVNLVCTFINFTNTFMFIGSLGNVWFYTPSALSLLQYFFVFSARVLLLLYVIALYKHPKTAILVPIALLIAMTSVLISTLCFSSTILSLFSNFTLITAFILISISAFLKFKSKALVIVSMVLALSMCLVGAVSNIEDILMYIDYEMPYYVIVETASLLGGFAFYTALLIFGVSNRLPSTKEEQPTPQPVYAPPQPTYVPPAPVYMPPQPVYRPQPPVYAPPVQPTPPVQPPVAAPSEQEKALQWLREGLDSGLITAEQYQAKREEILNDKN